MPLARFSFPSILLHWLTALLIVAAYATIELREVFPRGSGPREALKAWHYGIGLSIFALVWLRLLLRLILPKPAADTPRWQALASGIVHFALYLFMIAMPLIGWLLLSAEGDTVVWLGIELPPLAAPSEALAERVEELHEAIGKAGYFLIGIHAAAALLHHYLLRDRILQRMLPPRLGPILDRLA